MSITPTADEFRAGRLSPETLFMAINNFNRDGFLVMEGVEDPALFHKLKDHLLTEGEEIKQASHEAERERPTKNFLQGPPSHLVELESHKLHKNPFVLQVMNAYLGVRPQFIYTCGNNAMKHGTERQRVHTDCRYLHPVAPYMVAAQWVLSDFTTENGATEVWPGSHLFTAADDHVTDPDMQMWIKDELVKKRAETRPPVQVECKVGGVFLRDMRLWHAGMPNKSDEDRIMLACGYAPRWFQCRGTIKLPKGVEHLYESTDEVEVMAEYLPMEEYKKLRHIIALDQFQTKLKLPNGMARRDFK